MSKCSLVPAGHRLLVKPDAVEEVSAGGIILNVDPDQELQAQTYGELVAVGANAWKAFDDGHPWAKVGDRVAFGKYVAKAVKDPVTEDLLFLINDEDVLCIANTPEQEEV